MSKSQTLSHGVLVLTEMESVRQVEATIKAKENLKRETPVAETPLFPLQGTGNKNPHMEFYSL